jgi:hypothetical protein
MSPTLVGCLDDLAKTKRSLADRRCGRGGAARAGRRARCGGCHLAGRRFGRNAPARRMASARLRRRALHPGVGIGSAHDRRRHLGPHREPAGREEPASLHPVQPWPGGDLGGRQGGPGPLRRLPSRRRLFGRRAPLQQKLRPVFGASESTRCCCSPDREPRPWRWPLPRSCPKARRF